MFNIENNFQTTNLLPHTSKVKEASHPAINKFHKGETIAKMLYDSQKNGNPQTYESKPFERLFRELDQFKCKNFINCGSTSYLIPNVKTRLFRDIGFILDELKCNLHGVYSRDVYSNPLDIKGRQCAWSSKKHSFIVAQDLDIERVNGSVTEASGKFSANFADDACTLDINIDWKKRITDIANPSMEMGHNELVIDYYETSILGILIYDYRYKKNNIPIDEFKEDGIKFQETHLNITGNKLPIFLLDSFTGKLSMLENT